jgi:hypothetical protein
VYYNKSSDKIGIIDNTNAIMQKNINIIVVVISNLFFLQSEYVKMVYQIAKIGIKEYIIKGISLK